VLHNRRKHSCSDIEPVERAKGSQRIDIHSLLRGLLFPLEGDTVAVTLSLLRGPMDHKG